MNNVIQLIERKNSDSRTKSNNVYIMGSIELIVEQFKERSINTYETYLRNYKEFFELILDKNMEFVTWEDFLSIGYEDILEYRKKLQSRGNINRTVNLKMASISTLYSELYKINREVDKVIATPTKLPEDDYDNNSYGSLTEEEIKGLLEYCEKLPTQRKPKQKKMFFKIAYVTAIRQGAILSMQWDDITPLVQNKETVAWVITLKDKGSVNKTPITPELYEELLEIKSEDSIQDGRVFPTTKKTLANLLKEYCEFAGIDHKERKIVLHSLKKASIDKVYHETKNIIETAKHGHHKNIDMVYEFYEGKNKGIMDKPSVNLFDKKVEENIKKVLQNYSKYDIIEAVVKSGMKISQEIINELERGEN